MRNDESNDCTRAASRLLPLRAAVTAAVAGAVLIGCAGHAKRDLTDVDRGRAAYARKDYATAARLLMEPAMKGDPNAQYALGYMYYYGQGVPKDLYRSRSWLETAATLGHRDAQRALTLLHVYAKLPPEPKREEANGAAIPKSNAAAPHHAPSAATAATQCEPQPQPAVAAAPTTAEAAPVQPEPKPESAAPATAAAPTPTDTAVPTAPSANEPPVAAAADDNPDPAAAPAIDAAPTTVTAPAPTIDPAPATQAAQETAPPAAATPAQEEAPPATAAPESQAPLMEQAPAAEPAQPTPLPRGDRGAFVRTAPEIERATLTGAQKVTLQSAPAAASAPRPRYTIHLLSSRHREDLSRWAQLHQLGADVAYYQVQQADGIHYRLIFGGYDTVAAARRALDALPAARYASNPWVNNYPVTARVTRFNDAPLGHLAEATGELLR